MLRFPSRCSSRVQRKMNRYRWSSIISLILLLTGMYTLLTVGSNHPTNEANLSGPLDEIDYVKLKPRIVQYHTEIRQSFPPATPIKAHLINAPFEYEEHIKNTGFKTNITPVPETPQYDAATAEVSQILQLYAVPIGGLGNQLFQAAACISIAKSTGRQPVLTRAFERLYWMFKLPVATREVQLVLPVISEDKYATFSPHVFKLPNSTNVILYGFFQSWRYFLAHQNLIKHHFKLKEFLQKDALQEKENACKTICSRVDELKQRTINKNTHLNSSAGLVLGSCNCTAVVCIGVHIRRQDIGPNYNEAPNAYINHAMAYFRKRHRNSHFMVISDDISWCRKHLTGSDVYIVPEMTPEHHFAVLSKCDHHVLTVGTFGWWAAWLAGGETVYFDNPIPESFYNSKHFNMKDYFPSAWVPLH